MAGTGAANFESVGTAREISLNLRDHHGFYPIIIGLERSLFRRGGRGVKAIATKKTAHFKKH